MENRSGTLDGATAPPSRAPVILYDGVCGLCDRYVQFVLRHDRRRRFRFAPLQGRFAAAARARDPRLVSGDLSSIVLIEGPETPAERARVRSDAVLAILVGMGGAWRLAVLLRLIPGPLRDWIYAGVARVRYRVFGRFDACAIPPGPAASAGRFLD